jgi:TonB-linked SusC/RagA family outer membrane protein
MRTCFLNRPSFACLYKKIFIAILPLVLLVLGHHSLAQSQPPGAQPVTVKVERASLDEVLQILRRQVKLQFVIDAGVSDKYGSIQLNMVNVPLSDVLNKLLAGKNMEYVINKNVIIIRKTGASKLQDTVVREALLQVMVMVRGENGASLAGATVADAGDQNKAGITDNKGQLTVTVAPSARLRVSFIGYEPQWVPVGNRKQVHVILKTTDKAEDEVVITGYQNLHKWESVGATTKVKGEDIRTAGIPRVDIALQGQIPGVSITIPNGVVGSNPKVRVRGTSTLMGNREPVWVVDGIIREDPFPFKDQNVDDIINPADKASMLAGLSIMSNGVAGLNPDDIEDITFLKDASATALYGVRAANGVIVITTKRGKVGRTNINFRSDVTVTQKPGYRDVNLMNSSQRVALSKELIEKGVNYAAPNLQGTPAPGTPRDGPQDVGYEGLYYRYINKEITQQEFNDGVSQLEMNNTDWFGELFRYAINQNYTLSLSGGSDKATYYASLGYNKTANSAIGNDQTRMNALVNIDYRLHARVRLRIGLEGAGTKTNGFYSNVNPTQYALTTNRVLRADQFYALYDKQTSVTLANGNNSVFTSHLAFNFLNELAHTGNTVDGRRFNVNTNLQVTLTKDLVWQSLFSQNFDRSTAERWADERSFVVAAIRGANFGELPKGSLFEQASVLPRGGIIEREEMNRDGYLFRNTLNYNKTLGGNQQHNLNLMGGLELRSNTYKGAATKNYGYFPDRGDVIDYDYSIVRNSFDVITNKYYNKRTNTLTNFLSYFASFTYSYKRKYTLNFNGRNDASNRFGQYSNAAFNPVWAAGIRWDVLEERLFKNRFAWLNTLTLRSSFGFQGNIVEAVGPNLIAQYGTPVYNTLNGESYLNIRSMPYPDLRKEKTRTTNIGLDLSVLNNRVAVTFDYYYKYSKDLISLRLVPLEYGTTQMYVNGSDMVNKGFDLAVRLVPVRNKDWSWTIQFNTSMNRNNVVKPRYVPNLRNLTNGTALVDGYPVDAFWSFDYVGLNPANGKPMFRYLDKDTNLALLKGTDPLKYLVYSGNALPKIYGGVNTSIRFRNLALAASFNLQLGYKLRLNPMMKAGTNGQYQAPGADKNASQFLVNRWQKPGDENYTDIPAIYAYDEGVSTYFSDPSIATSVNPNNGAIGTIWYRYSMYNYSDLRVVNGSHLRCNNIVLTYSFTKQQLARLKVINQLTIAGNVTNPFLIASGKLHGQDPEILSSDANNVTPNMPRMKTASFSINVGF